MSSIAQPDVAKYLIHDPFGCRFPLNKLQVNPVGTAAEAVDFGYGHSEIYRLTLKLIPPLFYTEVLNTPRALQRYMGNNAVVQVGTHV